MSGYRIQADYDRLASMAQSFAQNSDETLQLLQQVNVVYESLASGGWIGTGAEAFFEEMRTLVTPAVRRLSGALSDAGRATRTIINALEAAEEEAGYLFRGVSGGGHLHQNIASGTSSPGKVSEPIVNLMAFTNGHDGWHIVGGKGLVDMFMGYPLLAQTGGTCTAFAALNLIKLSGLTPAIDGTPVPFDENAPHAFELIAKGWVKKAYADFLPGDFSSPEDVDLSKIAQGLPPWEIEALIDAHLPPGYTAKTFNIMGFDEAHPAEKDGESYLKFSYTPEQVEQASAFLVEKVGKEGMPVNVFTGWDSKSLSRGGHAYNIVGVQTDADGNLTNVIAFTNWGSEDGSAPFVLLPAKPFVESWLKSTGGEAFYIGKTE